MSLTDEDELRIQEAFTSINVNGGDNVDVSELYRGAQLFGLNPTRNECETAIASVDLNADGQLSQDEFRNLVLKMMKTREQMEAELDKALQALGDGDRFTKDEFRTFIQSRGDDPLTDVEVDELFADIDTDGDMDTISRQELIALFTQANM
ncbi:calmodulin-like isoform X2 [Dreissena polymorpha]|uniref:EF-hand domain-containing protein n=1 Tax=Dreissena polymorpha TaxID=45954 RepID=A0A9D4EXC4_DREPO|nr:calmodulin-like isoform X2 [Dreissena polymorpha]KAH3787153.1 hypothetical protein DPMN_165273 [Dreissena polymorpha]